MKTVIMYFGNLSLWYRAFGSDVPRHFSYDATGLRLFIASRVFHLHPSRTVSLRFPLAQPDCFRRNTGSTLRVISTLMCARVTSLDSAQALPKYREGSDLSPPNPTAGVTLPRPPLRTSCPKNPTKEIRSPWTLSPEDLQSAHLLKYIRFLLFIKL
jgi:hypothetical protein